MFEKVPTGLIGPDYGCVLDPENVSMGRVAQVQERDKAQSMAPFAAEHEQLQLIENERAKPNALPCPEIKEPFGDDTSLRDYRDRNILAASRLPSENLPALNKPSSELERANEEIEPPMTQLALESLPVRNKPQDTPEQGCDKSSAVTRRAALKFGMLAAGVAAFGPPAARFVGEMEKPLELGKWPANDLTVQEITPRKFHDNTNLRIISWAGFATPSSVPDAIDLRKQIDEHYPISAVVYPNRGGEPGMLGTALSEFIDKTYAGNKDRSNQGRHSSVIPAALGIRGGSETHDNTNEPEVDPECLSFSCSSMGYILGMQALIEMAENGKQLPRISSIVCNGSPSNSEAAVLNVIVETLNKVAGPSTFEPGILSEALYNAIGGNSGWQDAIGINGNTKKYRQLCRALKEATGNMPGGFPIKEELWKLQVLANFKPEKLKTLQDTGCIGPWTTVCYQFAKIRKSDGRKYAMDAVVHEFMAANDIKSSMTNLGARWEEDNTHQPYHASGWFGAKALVESDFFRTSHEHTIDYLEQNPRQRDTDRIPKYVPNKPGSEGTLQA